MKPKIDYTLYLVSDRTLMSTQNLEEAVEQSLKGGCTLVQLREKDISSGEFYNLALRIKEITDKYNVPLIINDRADIAFAVGAAGVHVGQDDLPCIAARKIVGENKIVGVSVSTVEEALKAEADGADYIGVGAMFSTNTKTDAKAVSREELIKITRQVSIPIVAIGGINEKTLPFFDGIDIDGIAVVSAIIAQKDITAAAQNIKMLFTANKRPVVRGISAAIFDLDGTLLDSMDIWEKIDIAFLKKRGYDVPAFFLNKICALSFREAADYTIKLFNLNDTVDGLIDEWNAMAFDEYAHNIRLKEGAEQYLRELKNGGIRLAVATSLPKRLLEPVLKNNGVYDLFKIYCSVDEVKRGKEHPDFFEYAIKRLDVEPSACVIFEDLLATVKSAKQTGALVCGVYDKYSEGQAEDIQKTANLYIRDFKAAPVLFSVRKEACRVCKARKA